MTTPLGSAVAPDVKMIWMTSSRETSTLGIGPSRCQSRSAKRHCAAPPKSVISANGWHVVADQHDPRVDEAAHAADEFRRRAVVDRDDDDAGDQAAPVAGDPFGTVLAPEDDLVALAQAGGGELRREPARRAADVLVRVAPAPIPVVVDEELAADRDEVAEEVDQRIARHAGLLRVFGEWGIPPTRISRRGARPTTMRLPHAYLPHGRHRVRRIGGARKRSCAAGTKCPPCVATP